MKEEVGWAVGGLTTPINTTVKVWAGILPVVELRLESTTDVEDGWVQAIEEEDKFVPEMVAQLVEGNEVVIVDGKSILMRPELLRASRVVTTNV